MSYRRLLKQTAAGDVEQRSRRLSALQLSSVPSIQVVAYKPFVIPTPGDLTSFLGASEGTRLVCGVYIYKQEKKKKTK